MKARRWWVCHAVWFAVLSVSPAVAARLIRSSRIHASGTALPRRVSSGPGDVITGLVTTSHVVFRLRPKSRPVNIITVMDWPLVSLSQSIFSKSTVHRLWTVLAVTDAPVSIPLIYFNSALHVVTVVFPDFHQRDQILSPPFCPPISLSFPLYTLPSPTPFCLFRSYPFLFVAFLPIPFGTKQPKWCWYAITKLLNQSVPTPFLCSSLFPGGLQVEPLHQL